MVVLVLINIKSYYIYILASCMVIFTIIVSAFIMTNNIFGASLPLSGKCIVIDAGHGGLDGGAVSKDGTAEKDINLKIAMHLRKMLVKNGAEVIMTRTEDISLHSNDEASVRGKKRSDLNNRRELVNNSNADFLISIHLNYFVEPQYKGAQMFYEGSHPESKILGEILQKSLIENLDSGNTRVAKKLDTMKLLFNDLSIPGVIAECGFLSNYEETQKLKNSDYQQKIAKALYLGINEYFNTQKPMQSFSALVFLKTVEEL